MPSAGVNRCFQSGAGGIASELWPRVLDLDERALFAEARRRTRLEDFADDETFHQALGRLISSYETEAHLKLIGRVTARQRTIRLLMNRLSLVEDRARRPEIAGQEIRSPLFLTGLPRSGTTLLHALLAQDPENRAPLHWEAVLPSPPPDRDSHAADPRIAAVERQLLWLVSMPVRASAHDAYDDSESNPLRLAAYALYPVGFALEWLVMRPIHFVVSQPKLEPVSGTCRTRAPSGTTSRISRSHRDAPPCSRVDARWVVPFRAGWIAELDTGWLGGAGFCLRLRRYSRGAQPAHRRKARVKCA